MRAHVCVCELILFPTSFARFCLLGCLLFAGHQVISAVNFLIDDNHHYLLHPFLDHLRVIFALEDELQLYRFQLSCDVSCVCVYVCVCVAAVKR